MEAQTSFHQTASNEEEEARRAELIQKNRKNSVYLAVELMNSLPAIVRSDDSLYVYNGKHYDLLTREDIEKEFNRFMLKYGITDRWKLVVLSEIVRFIQSYALIKDVKMNGLSDHIVTLNGVLNTETLEFFAHSPDFYFDSCLNIEYEPTSDDCPVFMEYLTHVTRGDAESIENIIRLGGYLLDNNPSNMKKTNKLFIFDGDGGSGKSTLLDTFKMFFSEDRKKKQVTSLSLEEITGKNFENAQLLYSRVNISPEQKRGFIDSEKIKQMTEGSDITVRGLYQEAVTVPARTKLIVACNGAPKFNDSSNGIYRRLMIFKFRNLYYNQYEYNRTENPELHGIYLQDRELSSKIRQEKNAIFTLFLKGLKRLKEDNFLFLEGNDFIRIIESFKSDNDVAREFLKEKYVVDECSFMPLKDIFDDFKFWHHNNVGGNNMKFRSNELGRRIKEIFVVGSNGTHKYSFDGKLETSKTYPLRRLMYDESIDTDGIIFSGVSGSEAVDVYETNQQRSLGLSTDSD